jgi:hypothetical protein
LPTDPKMKFESRTLIASFADGNWTLMLTGPSTSGIGGSGGAGRGVMSRSPAGATGAGADLGAAAGGAEAGTGAGAGGCVRGGVLHAAAKQRVDAMEKARAVRMRRERYSGLAGRR